MEPPDIQSFLGTWFSFSAMMSSDLKRFSCEFRDVPSSDSSLLPFTWAHEQVYTYTVFSVNQMRNYPKSDCTWCVYHNVLFPLIRIYCQIDIDCFLFQIATSCTISYELIVLLVVHFPLKFYIAQSLQLNCSFPLKTDWQIYIVYNSPDKV